MQIAYLAYIGGIATFGVQLVLFLRWLHRRMRDDEVMRAFVRDMATVQLPYLHKALRIHGRAMGVEIDDPPPIQYVEFNNRGKSGGYNGFTHHW